MRKLLKNIIAKSGWELRKILPPEPSGMVKGLTWLQDHQIKFDTILDVGASNGCWSKECQALFPKQNYVLYEPHPSHADDLNAFQGKYKESVSVDCRAVGDREGRIHFNISDLWGASIDSTGSGKKSIEVDLTTIDQSLKNHKFNGPYLIKLDTHGFEKGILDGAEQTLKNTEVLVVECYNYEIEKGCFLFWELCDYLSQRGFRPVYLVDVLNRKVDDSLWQMDMFFIKSTWDGFNNISYQ